MVLRADERIKRLVAQFGFDFLDLLRGVAAAGALECQHLACCAVEYAAERLAVADGPVHGIGVDAQHRFDFLHEVERVARFAVHLVHEREDGDMAQRADFEQLLRLGLDALCAIDDHDGGVRGHERAVRILGEILVAGRIEDVHAAAVVFELQYGRCDGDAACLLDVHPVGHGMLRAALALHGTGRLDAAAVQQQLLGQRRFARVGVGDDGERPAGGYLVGQAWHVGPFFRVRAQAACSAARMRYLRNFSILA